MRARSMAFRTVAGAIGVLAVTGCNGSFSGSGTMTGAAGGAAIVKMKVICDVDTQEVSGSFLYMDPSSRVNLRGAAVGKAEVSMYGISEEAQCDNDPTQGHYVVRTRTQEVRVDVQQVPELNGRTCSSGYAVTVAIISGPRAGYANASCVRGKMTPITTGSGLVGRV